MSDPPRHSGNAGTPLWQRSEFELPRSRGVSPLPPNPQQQQQQQVLGNAASSASSSSAAAAAGPRPHFVDASGQPLVGRTTFYSDAAAPLIGGSRGSEAQPSGGAPPRVEPLSATRASMQVPLFSVASPMKKGSGGAGGSGSTTPAATNTGGGMGRSTLELGFSRPRESSAASRPTQNYILEDNATAAAGPEAGRPSALGGGRSGSFGGQSAEPSMLRTSSSSNVGGLPLASAAAADELRYSSAAPTFPQPSTSRLQGGGGAGSSRGGGGHQQQQDYGRINPLAQSPSTSAAGSRHNTTSYHANHPAGASSFHGAAASPAKAFDDASFLQDILYCWMGTDQTQYFVYNAPQRRYEMREGGGGSLRQQATFESLQGCGAAAKMIDETLRKHAIEPSFLQQSLRSAVRKQLTQYHYFVSSFREKGAAILLGDLVQASKKVHPKLVTLLAILIETERAKGGELVTKLQMLQQQGSQRLAHLMHDIYIEAIGPLLVMTVQYLLRGEASDPFHEFFLTSNPKVEDSSDAFWTEKFSVIPDMIPTTVPKAVADKVLLVAKNVAFIKRCCRAKDWRMDPAIANDAQSCTFETLPKVVQSALVCSNNALMRLVQEKLKLQDVLNVVNAFLLVGNGDFFEMLIRRLDALLLRPSTLVQSAAVREQMQSALLEISPHAKGLDADLLHAVQCELLKDDKIIGWDAFVVTMPVSSPLNNIFDGTAMKVYKRLFRMMFKVKRSEVSLKQAWRQSVVLDRILVRLRRDDPSTRALREVAGDAHLLGLELSHFVTNLWSYIVCEVCTAARDKLTQALQSCTSLDEVRAAHNQYLQQLTLYSLLHVDCASTKQNIDAILSMTREYCTVQSLLTNLLERQQGDLGRIRTEYQRIQDAFHKEMSHLLSTLEEQHLQFDFMNFLFLRINFNQFYRDTSLQGSNTEF